LATIEPRHSHHPPANEVTIEVRATAKYVRTAPRKAQLVASEIRGLTVPQARTVLAFMPRAAAREIENVLASAVANAEANHGLVGDDLYVLAADIGNGPMLKRWRARARGRVGRIRKRTCHITIRLAPVEGFEVEPVTTPAVAEQAPAPRRARRATTEAAPAAVETPPTEEVAAEEVAAEEVVPEETVPEETAPAEASAEEVAAEEVVAEPPAEKPTTPRRSRKKAAEPPAEEAPAPKATRPRKKTDESSNAEGDS
jgi:large subunit ribosomal protein L22